MSRVSYRQWEIPTIYSGFQILDRSIKGSAYVSMYLIVLRTYDNAYNRELLKLPGFSWDDVGERLQENRLHILWIRPRAKCFIYVILTSFVEGQMIIPILQVRKWMLRD